jgi:hypothetical protein
MAGYCRTCCGNWRRRRRWVSVIGTTVVSSGGVTWFQAGLSSISSAWPSWAAGIHFAAQFRVVGAGLRDERGALVRRPLDGGVKALLGLAQLSAFTGEVYYLSDKSKPAVLPLSGKPSAARPPALPTG